MRFSKKVVTALIVLALALMPMTAFAVSASSDITVTVDGEVVTFEGQQPVIVSGRTLVPVRGVFEHLGFTPTWSGSTQTATLTRDDYTIVITIGSATFTTNGAEYELDVPAQMISGRTMLPIRAVLESVGYELDWVSATRTVVITTGTDTAPPVDTAVAEAELAAFLSGMDLDLVRFALGGVDFTVGMTEHTAGPGGIGTYRFLSLDGELGIDINIPELGSVSNTNAYSTRTGDVILHRAVWEDQINDFTVIIDIGATMDIWTAYPELIPDHVREFHDGIPYWMTEVDRALVWFVGGVLYRENFLSINHFLHTSGGNTVRDIIGVDFTPDATEWASERPAGYNWLALHPSAPVNLDAFEANYQSNMFTTQTGDVFIATFRYYIPNAIGAIYLYIDLGSLYDVFGAEQVDIWRDEGYELTEADRMFHRVQLWVTDWRA